MKSLHELMLMSKIESAKYFSTLSLIDQLQLAVQAAEELHQVCINCLLPIDTESAEETKDLLDKM